MDKDLPGSASLQSSPLRKRNRAPQPLPGSRWPMPQPLRKLTIQRPTFALWCGKGPHALLDLLGHEALATGRALNHLHYRVPQHRRLLPGPLPSLLLLHAHKENLYGPVEFCLSKPTPDLLNSSQACVLVSQKSGPFTFLPFYAHMNPLRTESLKI